MRILQIHNNYQQRGGEEEVVEAESKLLLAQGHQVTHYTRDNREIEGFSLSEKAEFFLNTVYSQHTRTAIRDLVRVQKPDVAHIHNIFPLISPSVYGALKDCGVPVVQTVHNYRWMCPKALFLRKGNLCEKCANGNTLHAVVYKCYQDSTILSALYAAAIGYHRYKGTLDTVDKLVCVSKFVARKFTEYGLGDSDRICVVPNFVPDSAFQNEEPVSAKHGYVGYIGRLSEEKGLFTLLHAFSRSKVQRLKIAGNGPLRNELEELAERLELGERVEFVGYLSGNEKKAFLCNALAIVLPSEWYETFGLTVVEGYSQKTPAIVSDLGGLPEVVRDGETGFVFTAGDQEDLTDKLNKICDPNLSVEMGFVGYQWAGERFSAAQHYDRLLEIYDQVIQ